MKILRWIAAVALAASVPAVAAAQTDSGRISGYVRDSSNALVVGAKVKVTNTKTGDIRTTTTDKEGHFLVAPLSPATYTIRTEREGFAPVEYADMPVAVGQELSLDFEFKPAGVTEQVTVVGSAPVIDLSSAKLGVNVSEREVSSLPVNGRQMSQLMLQAPGAQNAGTGTWQDVRFSGMANEQNVIKYDGIEGSAIIDASPGNVNGENNTPFKLQASLENVQEFRVESSNYPAEFGTGTGGQVSVVTKSGGNAFHGALFEYLRNDRFDEANYFDSQRNADGSVIAAAGSAPTVPKSPLKQNQFGGSFGGRLVKDRVFFFASYEGYRLDAGKNFLEAVPSDAAWARAVPAVAGLRAGFLASTAHILPGVSKDPDFDIAQNQATQHVTEDAFSARLDVKLNQNWSSYVRLFNDSGTNNDPQGVTGRFFQTTAKPRNVVADIQGILSPNVINDFKFGYNGAPTTENGVAPTNAFSSIILNLAGSVANTGIAGQGASTGLAIPGGLVRLNSAGNGRSAPYNPYSLTFADSLSKTAGTHYMKVGVDIRAIRMSTDQQGGITYSFANVGAFLADTATTVQYFGDLSEPSPFNNGATGLKHTKQEYYVAFAQDEWKMRDNLTLNYGLRYDYYAPLREADNRIVKFNIETGVLDPNTTAFYKSKKDSFQPRVSVNYSPTSKTVLKTGFGVFVGPGQTEDQIQPIEADRISTTVSNLANAYPADPAAIRLNFTANPNNRSFQPRAYSNDYTLPEKQYQYTASVQRDLGGSMSASAAYVGAQGRNLFLRSIANRTIGVQTNGASAATQVREFDIVTCASGAVLTGSMCPGSSISSIQRPFSEIDYKTSGGYDSYNALQLSVTRRSSRGISMNAQYTLGYSKGDTGGSNEAATAANNARALSEFDYDNGYNNFDVRHNFNLSLLYTTPGTGMLTGGWTIGGIMNARSGLPVPVLITRPDFVYVDGSGAVWTNPAADRIAVINKPGGGASRNISRPDLIPGVDPFITDGGLVFLNPAAFATPKPGTLGNLERNSIHGPGFKQIDMVLSKKVLAGKGPNAELRMEVFNLFNITNFANPAGTLPNALPGAGESTTQANRTQPGQPFTSANAGAWGKVASTVGTTVGLGTSRQVQFALRLTF